MLNISTDSWHYRMNWEYRHTSPPSNLCPYIRFTIVTVVVLTLGALIALAVGFCAGQYIQIMFYGSTGDNIFFMIGGLFWIVTALITTLYALSRIITNDALVFAKDKLDTINEYYEQKEPSLIIEWIKAKHNKICPQLNFVDKPNIRVGSMWTNGNNGEQLTWNGEHWFPLNPSKGDTYVPVLDKPMIYDGEKWIHDEVSDPFHDILGKDE